MKERYTLSVFTEVFNRYVNISNIALSGFGNQFAIHRQPGHSSPVFTLGQASSRVLQTLRLRQDQEPSSSERASASNKPRLVVNRLAGHR